MRENMIPGKSNDPCTGKCIVFVHLLNDFVIPCSVDPQKSLAEQIIDMENVCGQFPKDKYFVHGGKTVVLDKPFQEQGIVGDCNIKVLLRLRGGGGGGKEGAGEGEHSKNAIQINEAELQDLWAKLNNITDGKPGDIEVEVRARYSEINSLEDSYDKKKLLTKLTAVAIRGLQEELQNLLKENGLSDMALQLVCDYTTRQTDLAKELYQAQKYETKQDEFYVVLSKKLLPKFETLGALVSNDIEVEGQNSWVEQLIKRSPSLTKLRRMNYSELDNLITGATDGDRSVVENLFAEGTEIREQCQRYGIGLKTAEKLERKGVESASDMSKEQLLEIIEEAGKEEKPSTLKKMYSNESSERARERKEQDEKTKQNKKRIEEAKGLVKEARNIIQEASEQRKTALLEKVKEIANKLSLPEGWDKQEKDDPYALLEQLNREINIASDSLAIPPYVTNEDIAAAASGGLALYGILFEDNNTEGFSESPPFPLLKRPEYVEWLSPALGFQVRFFKSTEQQASTKFYNTTKSSGVSIAASVTGSGWGVHASVSGDKNNHSSRDTSTNEQDQTTRATVTQYICQPTKAFRIPLEDMELNKKARSHAKEIKDEKSAEKFLKMYGSHMPNGIHTLGGVFFRNVNVITERKASVSEVMMVAGKQFDVEVSAGFSGFGFSVGGSVKTGSFDISGSTKASSTKEVKFMSEMTVQALGPPTTNSEMFSQLLQSNNATWYVIDRGDRAALVPVWELMADLKEQAEILEKVWKGQDIVWEMLRILGDKRKLPRSPPENHAPNHNGPKPPSPSIPLGSIRPSHKLEPLERGELEHNLATL
ncbi:interferon-induced very large GTPase 1-like isoform X3 [Montipora capricornis]|uniref:interferon-induced very large GTPase 1-like isoform X3 n=1 Tax=Montipora capricornis TaxID=246305 RepID=UPI0035F1BDBA